MLTQTDFLHAAEIIDGLSIPAHFGVNGSDDEFDGWYELDSQVRDMNIGSFSIEHPAPGFYSLIGIKTPGLTCANELGLYLAKETAMYLEAEPNPGFDIRPMGPTIPHVPIPDATALPAGIFSLNMQVAMGPVMADANVAGIHMKGFLQMLPI